MNDDLRKECERGFRVWPEVGVTRSCPSGEDYVSFRCGITKEACPGDSYPTKQEAKEAFLKDFQAYAADKTGGVLYWRRLPTVEFEEYPPNGWRVCARVVISTAEENMK